MGTVRTQLKWELNDPLKLAVFLFGFLLTGLAFLKDALSMGATGMLSPFSQESAVHYAKTIPRLALPVLSQEAYSVLVFVAVMLSTLSIRGEMDSLAALTVYSLPIRKWKLFLIKFSSILLLTALSFVVPYFLAVGYVLSGSPSLLAEILGDGVWSNVLVFFLIAVFYTVSVSLFIALLSPNSFASILGGLSVLYVPVILGVSSLPPFSISAAMSSYLSSVAYGMVHTVAAYGNVVRVGFFLPSTLLAASIILSERRDAR
ncbi:hypothetical protein GQS_00885 [Thermococcus sp. 4557]|uniref:hypothetical protein n=1 Tax=Thermococcus sp. (strain CGMCC 1.5172 / 4557) TaxID=1042877 RepID=UPI000219E970|nr:hypothetical protein [Thermococcus sp. 4557]AEK72080.1 hypothetical protein GQS_00885 [Thermococcus sp. 4557]